MNYPDSVHFLYALGNEIKTAKLGLERIGAVLDALGRPQDRCRFVHVAGTNGKGSTCAMIESALARRRPAHRPVHLAAPRRAHRAHPHRRPADFRAEFAAAFDRVHAAVEDLLAAGAIDLHTTYFETVTAMALLVFAEQAVDMVVLEVGLGGRLDATNVVHPELVRHHAHRFRSRSVSGPQPGSHRRRKGGHSEARRAGRVCPAAAAKRRAVLERAGRGVGNRGRADGGLAAQDLGAGCARQPVRASLRRCTSTARWPASIRWRTPSPPPSRCFDSGWRPPPSNPASPRTVWPGRLERVSRAPRDHPRRRAQSRRRARAGRLHRPLLQPPPRAPDLSAPCATRPWTKSAAFCSRWRGR